MAIVTNVTNYSSDGSSTGDSITGTEWADALSGGPGNDTISGLGGNDNLRGQDGNDILDGGAGDDFLYVGSGSDTVLGGAGRDTLSYESSSSGVGLTLVNGTGQALHGVSTDSLSGIENVLGSSFGDVISMGDSDANGAYVFGNAGDDSLTGGANFQNFIGGSGADTIDGGAGTDQVSYAYTYNEPPVTGRGVVVDLAAGTVMDNWGSHDVLRNIENIEGSQYDDSLVGDSNSNYINGGAGADTIDGGAGSDQVNYYFIAGDHTGYLPVTGRGVSINLAAGTATDNWGNQDVLRNIEQINGSQYDDSLVGDSNNNSIYGGSGADTLDGGAGDDWLKGDPGNDLINGGSGNDRVGYDGNGSSGISVSLVNGSGVVTGGSGTDTINSIENVTGSYFDDVISIGDTSIGGSIEGRAGNDLLTGGNGSNYITGGSGADTIDGGTGTDTANYSNETYDNNVSLLVSGRGVVVNLATGTAIDNWGNQDILRNIEYVQGSQYSDSLVGDATNNSLYAGAGADTLDGGAGNDWLMGDAGDDLIIGGDGNDWVGYSSNGATTGIIASLNNGVAIVTGGLGVDTLNGIENISGSYFADVITMGDTTIGGGIEGRAGNDLLIGSGGNNDISGGSGADTIDGGTGFDKANYSVEAYDNNGSLSVTGRGVVVNLATGIAIDNWGNQDVLRNIEQVGGSQYDDSLVGDVNNNSLFGGSGADTLDGGAGNDWLKGEAGNDLIIGGSGSDWADYYSGNDISSGISVALNNGSGVVYGYQGTDTLSGIENISGSFFDDVISVGDTSIGGSIQGKAGSTQRGKKG